MPHKVKAPTLGRNEGRGINVVFAGDNDAHTIPADQAQFLRRHGIPSHRLSLFSSLLFRGAQS